MSTDATDIRCAECGRDITHATSIYLVSGRYVCDICYVWLTAPRDCKHGQLARSCEICELEAERDALAAEVERLRDALVAADRLLAEIGVRRAEPQTWEEMVRLALDAGATRARVYKCSPNRKEATMSDLTDADLEAMEKEANKHAMLRDMGGYPARVQSLITALREALGAGGML